MVSLDFVRVGCKSHTRYCAIALAWMKASNNVGMLLSGRAVSAIRAGMGASQVRHHSFQSQLVNQVALQIS
jgi:hypothetical protein